MGKGRITKEHILEQAFEFASQFGLESLTVGELAKLCGMSKSGLFAHFNSKTNLQIAVVEQANRVFLQRVIAPVRVENYASYQDKISRLLENWMTWNHSFQGSCMFLDAWKDSQDDELQIALKQAVKQWITYLTIQIEKGIEIGEFHSNLDAKQAAFELYGHYLSAHLFYSLVGEEESSARFWKSVETLLSGWHVSNK